jgi:hypothetical protein
LNSNTDIQGKIVLVSIYLHGCEVIDPHGCGGGFISIHFGPSSSKCEAVTSQSMNTQISIPLCSRVKKCIEFVTSKNLAKGTRLLPSCDNKQIRYRSCLGEPLLEECQRTLTKVTVERIIYPPTCLHKDLRMGMKSSRKSSSFGRGC